jgi:hypothetical protein
MLGGNPDYVRNRPVATKRALRAIPDYDISFSSERTEGLRATYRQSGMTQNQLFVVPYGHTTGAARHF